MKQSRSGSKHQPDRRKFLKGGVLAAGAATVGAGLFANGPSASGEERSGRLTPGDASILRFLAAAEILETDLWQQYNELGGVKGGNPAYILALQNLDGDMPHYIADNTDDEFSHWFFLKAYLNRNARSQSMLRSSERCRVVRRLGPSKSDGSQTC